VSESFSDRNGSQIHETGVQWRSSSRAPGDDFILAWRASKFSLTHLTGKATRMLGDRECHLGIGRS
jgi:hypothetical protein